MTKLTQNSDTTSSSQPSQVKPRVLIVDDHPGHRELLSTLLTEANFHVNAADGVPSAKMLLKSQQSPYDLILSDVNMPEESGFDLITWAKLQKAGISDVPVLFITSELPEPEHRIRGLALGAVDYVSRSLDIDELVLRVQHAISNFRRLSRLRKSLEDSEKHALAGRLLAASNHEIKNLATLVKVSTDQLAKIDIANNPNKGDFRSQLIEALRESSSLLVNISRNIGNLVNTRDGVTAPVDLIHACNQAVLILRPQISPMSLKFTSATSAPCWIAGNRTSIMQVLINLVLNSGDAIRELEIESAGQITISVKSKGENVEVTVTDNGIGFSEAGSRESFTAFESTKHLRGGQGLGLWLCQQLAEAMGGKLTLNSPGPGLGATAVLELNKTNAPDMSNMDLAKYYVY